MPKKVKNKWKSINTEAIEDALAEETRRARQKTAVDKVPDADLFYIDTAKDESAVARGLTARRRRREPKLLKCQAIINSVHSAKPVNPGHSRPKTRGPAVKPKPQLAQQQKVPEEEGNALDVWTVDNLEQQPSKRAKRVKSAVIQAVEVDAPGCSYNPDYEQHQDAVAEAVAAEMTKKYADEMVPKTGKVLMHMPAADELDALLEDPVSDEEDGDARQEPEEAAPSVQQTDSQLQAASKPLPGKKTRTDRNRDKRRKQAETALKAKASLKKQRRDLQSLKQLQHAIVEQEAEKQALAARKAADKAEAAKTKPPRLGRHKFEPQPMQVLLTDEIDGSLRRLKGTPVLSMERFKSLQKRGVIEPRGQLQAQRPRKKVTYVDKISHEERVQENEEVLEIARANARHEASKKASKAPTRANRGKKRR